MNQLYFNLEIIKEEYKILNNYKKKNNNLCNIYLRLSSSIDANKFISNINYYPYDPILKKNNLLNGFTPEDARIFLYNNNLYLFYNRCIETSQRLIHVLNINTGKEIVLGKNISTNIEKNWGLFIHDNERYVIYSIIPFLVYKIINNNDLIECKSKKYYKIFENFKNKYTNYEIYIRNSSKAVLYKNKYYALGHVVIHIDNLSNKYYNKLIKNNKEILFFKTYKKL